MSRMMNVLKPVSVVLILLIVLESIAVVPVNAQDVRVGNVRFELSSTKILITYDVEGDAEEVVSVKVILKREKDPSFSHMPFQVSGDIGEGAFVGKNKKITWEILGEFRDGLQGDDYYFVIEVRRISTGSNLMYYIGGGALLGVAAYLIGTKSKPETGITPIDTTPGSFPVPIGRPAGK